MAWDAIVPVLIDVFVLDILHEFPEHDRSLVSRR